MENYPELIASDAGDFRPTGIRNLAPGLVERGKIKIGKKGAARTSGRGNTFQPPQKLDHFTVTTTERGDDGNFIADAAVMKLLGDKPREIPVRLIYDDIDLNFPSRYAAYVGKSLWCTGNGEQARRANVDKGQIVSGHHLVKCPCPRQDPTYTGKDKCKITGTLSAVIDGADVVGGVWKFRTTSYNTVVGILSSLAMIKRISGGRLAGIPLIMKLSPKTVQDPIQGSQQTIYVVSLEFRGSVQALRDQGYAALLEDKTHGARIEQLEDQARELLADRRDEYEEEADDITDEFYPEAAAQAAGAPAVARQEQEHRPARSFAGQAPEAAEDAEFTEEPANDNADPEPEPEPEKKAAPAATKKAAEKPAAAKKAAAKSAPAAPAPAAASNPEDLF